MNMAATFVIINERIRIAERFYLEALILQLLERNVAGQDEHQADERRADEHRADGQFHDFHQELEVKRLIDKIFFYLN